MVAGSEKKLQKNKPRTNHVKLDTFRCGGVVGLQSQENGRLTRYQLEATRRVIVKHTNRKVRISLLITPNKSVTWKPIGIRMGKGKGAIKDTIYDIKPGELILEITGVENLDLPYILKKAGAKLPVKTFVVQRFF